MNSDDHVYIFIILIFQSNFDYKLIIGFLVVTAIRPPLVVRGSMAVTLVVVSLVRVAMAVGSLVIVRGSVAVTTMTVTAVGLNLDGVSFDDVLDLLVTGGIVVVATVNVVIITLGVITVTALVLAVVCVVVVVLHLPIKFVVGGMLG